MVRHSLLGLSLDGRAHAGVLLAARETRPSVRRESEEKHLPALFSVEGTVMLTDSRSRRENRSTLTSRWFSDHRSG